MIGILYALVPMFAWGSIGFVAAKLGGKPQEQTFGMTLGAFVFATVVFLIIRPQLTVPVFLIGMAGGVLWSIGQSGQFHGMRYLGVSVAGPLSGGSQMVLSALIGVFAFHEWVKGIQFVLGFIALLLLILGFWLTSKRDGENSYLPEHHHPVKGLISMAYSTLGYVIYVVLFNNLAGLWFGIHFDTLTIIFPMSIGMIIGAVLLAGGRIRWTVAVAKNTAAGVLWGVGNVFMLLAANTAGLAIAFTFSQLGALVTIVGSIFFLGERKTRKEYIYLCIGATFFVLGAVLLAVVKSQ